MLKSQRTVKSFKLLLNQGSPTGNIVLLGMLPYWIIDQ